MTTFDQWAWVKDRDEENGKIAGIIEQLEDRVNELAQPFADLAEQLEFVTAERDRLRDAVEILRVELARLQKKVKE